MQAHHLFIVIVLIAAIAGLSWLSRTAWRAGTESLQQWRQDRAELDRWRLYANQFSRWLAEFPAISLTLECLQAEALGEQVQITPNGSGPYSVHALREVLRRPASAPTCGGTIQLTNGHYFDFNDPARSEFDVQVIAAALSRICRFTGHCRKFYSVAQHAVLASYIVPPEHAYEALHHDDAEAFVNDLSKPLKELLPDYQRVEARVQAAVFARLGIDEPLPACVKQADMILLATEQRDLMPLEKIAIEWRDEGDGTTPTPIRWADAPEAKPWWTLRGIEPLDMPLIPWHAQAAERAFILRHNELLALRTVQRAKASAEAA